VVESIRSGYMLRPRLRSLAQLVVESQRRSVVPCLLFL
jgi:hypothetical protein